MALVITLGVGDTFTVGPHHYRVAGLQPEEGIDLVDGSGRQFHIDQGDAREILAGITFREGPRVLLTKARLAIVAPREMKILRGETREDSDVALLAVVPEVHLLSGELTCAKEGEVRFGSNDGMVFAELEALLDGGHCPVLIYASESSISGSPRVSWGGTFAGVSSASSDKHRPPSTVSDRGWHIHWGVAGLQRLAPDQTRLVSTLRGQHAARPYAKSFVPHRPLIIENPL